MCVYSGYRRGATRAGRDTDRTRHATRRVHTDSSQQRHRHRQTRSAGHIAPWCDCAHHQSQANGKHSEHIYRTPAAQRDRLPQRGPLGTRHHSHGARPMHAPMPTLPRHLPGSHREVLLLDRHHQASLGRGGWPSHANTRSQRSWRGETGLGTSSAAPAGMHCSICASHAMFDPRHTHWVGGLPALAPRFPLTTRQP